MIIEVTENARDQLLAFYKIKVSVFKETLIPTATPERSNFLLKKSAKLRRAKAEHKNIM